MSTTDNKLINDIPLATSVPTGSKVLGIDNTGATKLFTIDDLVGDFKGVAGVADDPGTPAIASYWITTEAGTYTHFGGVIVNAGSLAVISWNGTAWQIKQTTINMTGYLLSSIFASYQSFLDTIRPFLNVTTTTGVPFSITDSKGRVFLQSTPEGWFAPGRYKPASIPNEALMPGAVAYDQLAQALKDFVPTVIDSSYGYLRVWTDPKGRVSFGIKPDGALQINKVALYAGSILRSYLEQQVLDILPQALDPATGYLFALMDSKKRAPLAIKTDGTVVIPKLQGVASVPVGGVSYPSLDTFLSTLKPWQGKQWLTLGDSITAFGSYQTQVIAATGLTETRHAQASRTILEVIDGNIGTGGTFAALTQAEVNGKHLITWYSGLNDRSTPIGTRSDMYNPAGGGQATVYGYYNYGLTKLYSFLANDPAGSNLNCRVVLIAPHYVGRFPKAPATQILPEGYTNINDGVSPHNEEVLVNAIKDVAAYWNLPCIDLFHNCGINTQNIDQNTTDGIHLTSLGMAMEGTYIARQINNL